MHLLPKTSPFLHLHILTIVLAVYIGKSVSAPALNSAEIRSLIDPVQQRNPDENFEDPGVVVRSLFFFREKCKPGTQLSSDGKCLQVPMRDSAVTSSHAAFQLALNHAKNRKPKPHRKTPRPDQGTETVPTEATTSTPTTTAMFAETERTTLPTIAPNKTPGATTASITTTPAPFFVEVYTERYTTWGNPPEGSETTTQRVPQKYFAAISESTSPPTTVPSTITSNEVVQAVVPTFAEILHSVETTTKAGNDTNREIIPDEEQQQAETLLHTFSAKESESDSTDSPVEEEAIQNTDAATGGLEESDTTQLLNQYAALVPLFRDQGSTSTLPPLVDQTVLPLSTPQPEVELGDKDRFPHTIGSNMAFSKLDTTEQTQPPNEEDEKSAISTLTPGEIQGQAIIEEATPASFENAPTTPETIYVSAADVSTTDVPITLPNRTDEDGAVMQEIVQQILSLTESLAQPDSAQVQPAATAPSMQLITEPPTPSPITDVGAGPEEQPNNSSLFPSVSDIYTATMPPSDVYEDRPADIFREQPVDLFDQAVNREHSFDRRPVQDFQQRPNHSFVVKSSPNIFPQRPTHYGEERPLAAIFQTNQEQSWEEHPAQNSQTRYNLGFNQHLPAQNFREGPGQDFPNRPSRVVFPDESNEAPRGTRRESLPKSREDGINTNFFDRSQSSHSDQTPLSVLPGPTKDLFRNHAVHPYRYPSSTNQASTSGRLISYHSETQ